MYETTGGTEGVRTCVCKCVWGPCVWGWYVRVRVGARGTVRVCGVHGYVGARTRSVKHRLSHHYGRSSALLHLQRPRPPRPCRKTDFPRPVSPSRVPSSPPPGLRLQPRTLGLVPPIRRRRPASSTRMVLYPVTSTLSSTRPTPRVDVGCRGRDRRTKRSETHGPGHVATTVTLGVGQGAGGGKPNARP